MSRDESLSLSHPSAPHQSRSALWRSAVGIVAGPAAWFLQVCIGEALASEPCFPDGQRTLVPPPGLHWTWPALIGLLVACVLLAFVGFALSWQSYRATWTEARGDHWELLEAGAGRARFMAFWGVLYGASFCVITLFNLIAYIALPRCAG